MTSSLKNQSTLADRINELFAESNKKAVELAKYVGVSRATVSYWRKKDGTKKIDGDHAIKVGRFFGVNSEWVQTGEGKKQIANAGNDEKLKLFSIIDSADKAIVDSKKNLTDEQKLELYLEAIDVAGRKRLSQGLVTQYISEIITNNTSKHKE